MKTLRTMPIALAALLVALAAGCANEEVTETTTPDNGKMTTINVGMPDDTHTRVAFDDIDLSLKWQAGDKLKVTRNSDSKEYLLGSSDAGKTSGSFTGETVDGSGSGNYTVAYPVNFTSMRGQTQIANGSTAHLKDYILLEATPANLTDDFKLQMKSSIMKFILSGIPAEIGTLKSLMWIVEGTTTTRSLSLNLPGCSLTADALTAYLSFLPSEMDVKAGGKFSVILIGDKSYRAQVSIAAGKTYETGMRYNAEMNSWTLVELMAITAKVDNNKNGLSFNLPFPTSGTTPAEIIVNWGDGNDAIVTAGTQLAADDEFSHTYATAGTYTIVLMTDQMDVTKKQIPAIHFANNRSENDNRMKLLSIDTPLLNTGESNFFIAMASCKSITELPAGLFDKNTAITNFANCFQSCSSITKIPVGLFDKNTAAENFKSCFASCHSLTELPIGLFDKNIAAKNFVSCFSECRMLKLNDKIFSAEPNKDRFKDMSINVSNCFSGVGCELTDVTGSVAPDLWNYNATWNSTNCFENCNASNTAAADIPTAWGGSKQ